MNPCFVLAVVIYSSEGNGKQSSCFDSGAGNNITLKCFNSLRSLKTKTVSGDNKDGTIQAATQLCTRQVYLIK